MPQREQRAPAGAAAGSSNKSGGGTKAALKPRPKAKRLDALGRALQRSSTSRSSVAATSGPGKKTQQQPLRQQPPQQPAPSSEPTGRSTTGKRPLSAAATQQRQPVQQRKRPRAMPTSSITAMTTTTTTTTMATTATRTTRSAPLQKTRRSAQKMSQTKRVAAEEEEDEVEDSLGPRVRVPEESAIFRRKQPVYPGPFGGGGGLSAPAQLYSRPDLVPPPGIGASVTALSGRRVLTGANASADAVRARLGVGAAAQRPGQQQRQHQGRPSLSLANVAQDQWRQQQEMRQRRLQAEEQRQEAARQQQHRRYREALRQHQQMQREMRMRGQRQQGSAGSAAAENGGGDSLGAGCAAVAVTALGALTQDEIDAIANAKSSHADEGERAWHAEQDKRFDSMIKKDEKQERLANTTQIHVEAVYCEDCKKWSERVPNPWCHDHKHRLKYRRTCKRFFACRSCGHRATALADLLPDEACPKCGTDSWQRSGMVNNLARPDAGPVVAATDWSEHSQLVQLAVGVGKLHGKPNAVSMSSSSSSASSVSVAAAAAAAATRAHKP